MILEPIATTIFNLLKRLDDGRRLDVERLSNVIQDLADQMLNAVDRIESNIEKTKEYGSREMREQMEILLCCSQSPWSWEGIANL
jgi:hypothetical protein